MGKQGGFSSLISPTPILRTIALGLKNAASCAW
jgi:hypothetical protein